MTDHRIGEAVGVRGSWSSGRSSAAELRGVVAETSGGLLLPFACGATLLLALIFGGTREVLWPDALVQVASLPLLGYVLWHVPAMWRRGRRLAILVVAAIALLPLLQLIPLPPSVWGALPGRDPVVLAFQEAGLAVPWLGISLNPDGTLRAAQTLIAPVSIFLATLLLRHDARRALAALIVAFAFLSTLLCLAQLAVGSEGVGFFANRNHFAALLYAALPLTAAFAIGLATDRRREIWVLLALCLLVFATLLLGLGMSRSRAGVALAMLAGLGSFALAVAAPRSDTRKRANRIITIAAFAGVVLVLQFASIGLLQRFEVDVADDLRWEIAVTTLKAALDFVPVGSGFGTFEDVYRIYEGTGQLATSYVNHAHNDFAEALLEGGVFAVAIGIAFLFWFAVAAIRSWLKAGPRSRSTLDRSLPKAASIVILLMLLHSTVDYPLRTTALAALFAFTCALLIAPVPSADQPKNEADDKRRLLAARPKKTTGRPSATTAR